MQCLVMGSVAKEYVHFRKISKRIEASDFDIIRKGAFSVMKFSTISFYILNTHKKAILGLMAYFMKTMSILTE